METHSPSLFRSFRVPATVEVAQRYARILTLTLHYTNRVMSTATKDGRPGPGFRRHPPMMEWGNKILDTLRVRVRRIGFPPHEKAAMLVGNHVSYIDIPLLMAITPVVFVAKKQIDRWPVFGRACRSVGTIFVERESNSSRRDAGGALAPAILEQNQSVAIFPSGTTTVDESRPWRHGAFRIAHDYRLPVQPFRLRYTPVRRAAFIMEDTFVTHLWQLLASDGVDVTVELGEPRFIEDPAADCQRLWQWSREGLS